MARPLRVEFEGALYHVTARGNRREAIFANYADRERFLELLIRAFRQARSVAMWLVWQRCALSLREIGALFGGMDYAAVAQRIRRLEADRNGS